jgi:alpha-galactosidase
MSTYDEAGSPHEPFPVWESGDSYIMCLSSGYLDVLAERLIRLARDIGVRYFKLDSVWQYDCSNDSHGHGTKENTMQERRDCCAYNTAGRMSRLAQRLCEAYPDAIVDFDITEASRAVGLGFLAWGKYFLFNNGPYYRTYGLPIPSGTDENIFTYPGPARGWICRQSLGYDKWIPSVLFLTHYLPDDPEASQLCSLASLVLGQNGIWGDLPGVSEKGRKLFGDALSHYKRVRGDVTKASLKSLGAVGSSVEFYEKINPETGRGVISVFGNTPGTYRYRVASKKLRPAAYIAGGAKIIYEKPATSARAETENRAVVEVTFPDAGAALLIFE